MPDNLQGCSVVQQHIQIEAFESAKTDVWRVRRSRRSNAFNGLIVLRSCSLPSPKQTPRTELLLPLSNAPHARPQPIRTKLAKHSPEARRCYADQTYSGCVGSSGLFCGKSEIWPYTSIIQNSNEIGDHQMQIWQSVSYNSFLDITCTPTLRFCGRRCCFSGHERCLYSHLHKKWKSSRWSLHQHHQYVGF